ncbi:hypothetical protein RYX36_031750 [Vicia faba]
MVDQHATIMEKVTGQIHRRSGFLSYDGTFCQPAMFQKYTYKNYSNSALAPTCRTTVDLSAFATNASHMFIVAPAEKIHFLIDFLIGGVSAAVSKTATAPIERVKLLIQNQDEMIKTGRLFEAYKGIGDCFKRTTSEEGIIALLRGNTTNIIHYFPTQDTGSGLDFDALL